MTLEVDYSGPIPVLGKLAERIAVSNRAMAGACFFNPGWSLDLELGYAYVRTA